ncbi:SRPBCC family protein [Streptomyces decoyicus]|uniref:SRPBCC family protein n=1 Tax=Streptomyces decoyicus TaxID=249567 RepID=UPI0004AB63F1|nr:SRPBCC family protein [Streptomyces decoyicus]KOG42213.1 polyketide cyclase /reductase [Streptomyces decoyicus]QZY13993.1 SRPBCC family protein [Streptomyces decoyicus]
MSGIRSTSFRAALFPIPLVLGVLGTAAAPAGAVGSHASHTSHTSHPGKSLTCRGKGVDPDALVRHRTETVINAPLRTAWKLQTDVERWPSWQTPVETVERLDHGPFRKGSAFRWTIPIPPNPSTPATSLEITSTVQQIKPNSCIRWTGPAIGEGLRIDGVHVWNFTKVKGGVRVSTEETHTGAQVEADVPTATKILREGLEAWLRDVKSAAETRAHNRFLQEHA